MAEEHAYQSPRWTNEIADCALPMTFDQYSKCSYGCRYCFSQYQKSIGSSARASRMFGAIRPVDVDKVMEIFLSGRGMFRQYIDQRITMQWGGLADPFDEFERKFGVGRKLLRFFRDIQYPISFSTKSTWWTKDDEIMGIFKECPKWHVKISIITTDAKKAAAIERGVDTPQERLKAIERMAKVTRGGVTLRMRPYILGVTDHENLIRLSSRAGADSISTEFYCMERRSTVGMQGAAAIGEVCGYDIQKYYQNNSDGSGYMRLSREIKAPIWKDMQSIAHANGMRLHVSDAHGKDFSDGGCCCGMKETSSWSRGQFTQAIMLAKKNKTVHWREIAPFMQFQQYSHVDTIHSYSNSSDNRAKFHGWSLLELHHWMWNNPRSIRSPYKAYAGVLFPCGRDAHGDVIYRYEG
jgi:DNA repair photolyase